VRFIGTWRKTGVKKPRLDSRAAGSYIQPMSEEQDPPVYQSSPIWRDSEPPTVPAPAPYAGVLAHTAAAPSTPVPAHEERVSGVPVALAAGAAVALLGGLAWAAVGITTHYDIGILAWLIGAATGFVMVRIAGGPVDNTSCVLAGVFAALGIMVGKYVIFVHQLRSAFKSFATTLGVSVTPHIGYLDSQTRHLFFSEFSSIVKPIYILWVALAFFAAYRMAGGGRIFGRRLY